MMAADSVFAQNLAELMRQSFRQPPCVHKDQRCPMRINEFHDARVDFRPLFVHADGTEVARRRFDAQIQLPLMADVNNDRHRAGRAVIRHTYQKLRDLINRPLRRRQSDSLQPARADFCQTFERQCQMRPAFVANQCVNLINDHSFDGLEHITTARARQHQVQGFRSGHKNMWRPLDDRSPFRGRRVTRAKPDTNLWNLQTRFCGECQNLIQGLLKIAMHVIRQGAQR